MDLPVLEGVMRDGRKQLTWYWPECARVVEHGYSFSPCLVRVFIDDVLERSWKVGVWIVVVMGSHANHH